ncbi:hypothetical protein [Listeria seeligeri]|uniref:DUF308 domain-containing protein n=2 Tax=Listeria seeligeri TaxID=1640 RepID=A0ABR5E629_LISSE|nr:hypothetical protein [Listeria seeligeri]EFS01266.1 conserved hypothetical protein [Listeria seeligeri FSL N1-067]KKD45029.1 hypothetical protein UQ68_12105 [Listeria seeligeri]MBC1578074.1 hypothetical protein [Listeria seeligeri]MBC1593545.1 hypothetical protein [Listeria seeligeri]MBC1915990.1 hypothetical protein [Listeria seeligeri]
MTGLGTLLFLAGVIVLIFGILRYRKRNWPRRKTQIVIISSILAIIIGIGIIPSSETEEASNEKPKQTEKTVKKNDKAFIKTDKTFSTNDEGTLTIKGETIPGGEVRLALEGATELVTDADDDGNFEFSLMNFDQSREAVLSMTFRGETTEFPVSLSVSSGYETKLAEEKKAEAERVERERLAAEEQKAQEAKIAAEKKAEQDRIAAAEKAKAAETKRAEAERAAAQPDTSNKQGETVYITATGSKYHYSQSCQGLNNSNGETAVTVDEAKAQGFTLCGFE